MRKIRWGGERSSSLPLIQVHAPDLKATNKILRHVYKSGNFSNSGEIQKAVSAELSRNVNQKFAGTLVCNNTLGITAALLAIDVRGKHVLVSNFTFAATLHSIILAGGIPVVCDVDEETLEINLRIVTKILSCGKYNVGAVLPTRILGYVNDFSELVNYCKVHKIHVIIDAAAAFPSKSDHWEFEHQATFEVFSFHATKAFGIGEGGLIVGLSNNIQEVNKRINFGFTTESKNEFEDGLNAKADEFTAARAKVRMMSYVSDVDARREFASNYESFISGSNQLSSLVSNQKTIFSYFPIIFRSSELLLRFKSAIDPVITTRRYYFPSLYRGYRGNSSVIFDTVLDVSENIAPRILCLPVYSKFHKSLPSQIVSHLKKTLELIS